MKDSISTERFGAVLVELFAALALSLGAVGVYGVMAYAVAQRRQEVGIRMALGASRGAVLGMFLQEAAWLAVAGLGVGVLATLALTRCLQNILYGIQSNDPLVLSVAVIFLALVTAAASLLPALRALRVEPVTALRGE